MYAISSRHVTTRLALPQKWLLAFACLAAGIAPLAGRWVPGETARLAYGALLTAVLLTFTLQAKRHSLLRPFWELSFAFFVFALVQVLNNAVPLFEANVLREAPNAGNPLASTAFGTVVIQVLETVIAIVPIVVLTGLAGEDRASIYAQKGKLGRGLVVVLLIFAAVAAVAATGHTQRLFPTNGLITPGRFVALLPALLVVTISNGFQEEFLFRGLFLRRYDTFFGARVANVLQAIVFAVAHMGVTYTPIALLFLVLFVFPLGLLAGYLMRSSDGVAVPAIFHAALDLPIYLAFLSFAM